LFLPADADLAAAFSIPVSVKPLAGVRWAIGDGQHKNMQAGKKGILYWSRRWRMILDQLGVLGKTCF